MSVLVPSITNNNNNNHNHPHHHHASYFSNSINRRINGSMPQKQQNRLATNTLNVHEQESDHVPFGVVNSMKQRLLDKVNESNVFNHSSSLIRHPLTKPSSRIGSNENLLQTKTSLKCTTRLSRSQDNLTNNNSTSQPSGQTVPAEQFTSYIQPKQEVIIVDTTANSNHNDTHFHNYHDEGILRAGQKHLAHRQSYTELLVDEAPKPGTVTTVKNMFERQIRLSRYDADKIVNTSLPSGLRMNSVHRDVPSPTRSRSISPNDMAVRQRRTALSVPTLPSSTSTTLTCPVPTSYPDLVISHTPPAETNKPSTEPINNENHLVNSQGLNKEKKPLNTNRNNISQENVPLSVIVDECTSNTFQNNRPTLLLPSKSVSETVECQPLDFKSRLALFNRTNTQQTNENSLNVKKPFNQTNIAPVNILMKPVVHHPTRVLSDERKDILVETIPNPLSITISRSVVNIAKAVTFYGGNRADGISKIPLLDTVFPPPQPSDMNNKIEQILTSTSIDLLRAPDIIGGNVKLNKSSMFSGTKKNIRVQFIDNVDTYEYPSYELVMAEHGGSNDSDEDNDVLMDDSLPNVHSNANYADHHNVVENIADNKKINQNGDVAYNNIPVDDVDDDELERLARINAEFNTTNLSEKPLKPKGTLHTFRPTHLDQYELGTQHGSLIITKPSDTSSTTNPYTILTKQKPFTSSNSPSKPISNQSLLKQQTSHFDMANNIQWSSMSTTTDLLF